MRGFEVVAELLAIELLAAAQGIDLRLPLKTSPSLQRVYAQVRAKVPFYDHDRLLAPDIDAASDLIRHGVFNEMVEGLFARTVA